MDEQEQVKGTWSYVTDEPKPEATETAAQEEVITETPPIAEATQTETKPEITEPTPTYEDKFKEYGISGWDDIKKLKEENEKRIAPASDTITKLNDFISKGGTEREFYETFQTAEISKMSEMDKLVAQMKMEYAHLPKEEIQILLEDKYGIEYTEEDGELKLEFPTKAKGIQFREDARLAEKKLEEFKQSNSIPQSERQRVAQEEANRKAVEKWMEAVDMTTSSLKTLDIPLEGDAKFNYQVDNEMAAEINKAMKDPDYIYKAFPNPAEMAQFLLKGKYFDKIVSELSKTNKAKAVDEFMDKEMINPSKTSGSIVEKKGTFNPIQALREKIAQQR